MGLALMSGDLWSSAVQGWGGGGPEAFWREAQKVELPFEPGGGTLFFGSLEKVGRSPGTWAKGWEGKQSPWWTGSGLAGCPLPCQYPSGLAGPCLQSRCGWPRPSHTGGGEDLVV